VLASYTPLDGTTARKVRENPKFIVIAKWFIPVGAALLRLNTSEMATSFLKAYGASADNADMTDVIAASAAPPRPARTGSVTTVSRAVKQRGEKTGPSCWTR
jgi:hypothetical protein